MKRVILIVGLALLLSVSVRAEDPTAITTSVLVKSSSSWDGSSLPEYPKETPEITILRITIPAGAALPMHEHPVINAGVLLSGELTVKTEDDRTLHLGAGDPIVEVVNKWHYGKNTGKDPAVILVFYAGAPNVPLSIKK